MKRISLIFVVLTLLFVNVNSFAQQKKLFLILVHQPTNNEYPDDVGTGVDRNNIKLFANYVAQKCSMQISIQEFDAAATANTVKTDVVNYITGLSAGTDDVIWFYYTGHGSNCDGYPKTAYGSICLSEVHQRIKSNPPRLAIAMFDGCNGGDAVIDPNTDFMRTDGDNLKMLFLDAVGDIKACSSQSGSGSWGSSSAGGYFTIGFLRAIKEKANWTDVFETTKTNTKELARNRNRNQEPMFEMNISYNGTYALSDFVAVVRENETIEQLAKRVRDKLVTEEPDYDYPTETQFIQKVKDWNSGKMNSLKKGTQIDIRASQFKPKK